MEYFLAFFIDVFCLYLYFLVSWFMAVLVSHEIIFIKDSSFRFALRRVTRISPHFPSFSYPLCGIRFVVLLSLFVA